MNYFLGKRIYLKCGRNLKATKAIKIYRNFFSGTERNVYMDYLGNNQANVIGLVDSEKEFSHQVYGEKFFLFTLKVPRLSGMDDFLKVMVSERLLEDCECNVGEKIEVDGQFRSYNSVESEQSKLVLTVFAKNICYCDEDENKNELYLNGYICKIPTYRTTPFGREITDMLLAVNRTYNKSDYIPIIAWGRNARYCKNFNVGDNVKVWGRIQSRNYQKRISEDEVVSKTAYEVSVNRLEKIEEE